MSVFLIFVTLVSGLVVGFLWHKYGRSSINHENEKDGILSLLEEKLDQKEKLLEQKVQVWERNQASLYEREKKLVEEEKKYLHLLAREQSIILNLEKDLERISSLSQEEAKKELMGKLEKEVRSKIKEKMRNFESELKRDVEAKAKRTLALAVQRLAGEFVADSTVSVVSLASEDMKGRIIGREGRNIRALELATGVDLIVDDTPEVVVISCFNPFRREIARIALEKLLSDGRIHPSRIEETVKRVKSEFEANLQEYGEQAAYEAGIVDLHPELVALLGKLKFIHEGSYVSVLQHSLETAQFCSSIANEIGLNPHQAKRAGLLHDIAKALDHSVEGSYCQIGADLCQRYNESPEVVEAIKNHQNETLIVHESPLVAILGAANILSENRPGAAALRRDGLSSAIKRNYDIETFVKSYKDVQDAFVWQAGREVRVLVSHHVKDESLTDFANELADQVRRQLTFPGQVKISVVKETKYISYAKS